MSEFSVLIPCYNSAHTIARSLTSCLDQKYSDFEIIVVDDCSRDNLGEVVNVFRPKFAARNIPLLYCRNKVNSGAAFSRNVAWDLASGKYVCFLDADDLWHPAKLHILHDLLQSESYPVLFHGKTEKKGDFYFPVNIDDYVLRPLNRSRLLLGNPAQTSCIVLKRTLEHRFEPALRYCEDYDLWLRISCSHSVHQLCGPPLTLLPRRQQTPGGLSASRTRMRVGEIKAYARYTKVRKAKIAFPALLLFSILKHLRSELRYLVFTLRNGLKHP